MSKAELAARIEALETENARLKQVTVAAEGDAYFRRIADTAPVLLWITDTENACLFLSRSWYEFTGQTPENGRSASAGWTPPIRTTAPGRGHFLVPPLGARRFGWIYRLRNAKGNYRWAIDAGASAFFAQRRESTWVMSAPWWIFYDFNGDRGGAERK